MIHVTFSSSGAGSLRQALGIKDQRKKVVDLTDELDWGPIAHADFFGRESWLNANLPWESGGWDWIGTGAQIFEQQLERSQDHLVWVAPQNAAELCGLHWYLDRFGGQKAAFVIVDQGFPGTWENRPPKGIGELGVAQFQFLLGNAKHEVWDEDRFPQARWAQLCSDSTNLRIVSDGKATSVSDHHFDHAVLAQCRHKWRKMSRVIADVMISLWEQYHYVGDSVIAWRLRELALQGKIVASREIGLELNQFHDPTLIRLG